MSRVLQVRDLRVQYPTPAGAVKAVDGVGLDVREGEVVGIVGESGCGKTTLARSILGVVREPGVIVSGSVLFGGIDVLQLHGEAARRLRGGPVALTVQDASGALNPLRPVGVHVRETMEAHGTARRDAAARVVPLLRAVELPAPEVRARQRAHELSGGMRQRVMLAIGIANQPELLVADEVTTGLDAQSERHVIELLERLRADIGMSILLATHNLSLVARLCRRVVVMHAGRVVEEGPVDKVLDDPETPYGEQLVRSVRRLHGPVARRADRSGAGRGASALLSVEGVSKVFDVNRATAVTAVDDVTFDLRGGETFGLVGESGCGKSTLARLLTGLLRPTSGSVRFQGTDVAFLEARQLREFRRRVQIVLQDPISSLDPRMRVGTAIEEPLVNFRLGEKHERGARVSELMDRVGLSPELATRYPHQLSGGQCQRVAIARALAPDPALLVCDEPLSALDVATQARILDLLGGLQAELGLGYFFVSHDVTVLRRLAHRVGVMHRGRIVALGPPEELLSTPGPPRTRPPVPETEPS